MSAGRQSWPQGITGNWSDLITWPPSLASNSFKHYVPSLPVDWWVIFSELLGSVFLHLIKRPLRRNFTPLATSHSQLQTVPDCTEILQAQEESRQKAMRSRGNDTTVPGLWNPTMVTKFSNFLPRPHNWPDYKLWFLMKAIFISLLPFALVHTIKSKSTVKIFPALELLGSSNSQDQG